MIEFSVRTPERNCTVDITSKIKQAISKTGLNEGAMLIYVPHTTAAVTINEGADPDVQRDIVENLKKLIPHRGDYRHAEGNSDAHIKSTLVGVDRIIPVHNSSLVLGTWQKIFFCEFDGPRTRKFYVVPMEGKS